MADVIYSEKGFNITANQARHLNKYQDDFKAHNPLKKYILILQKLI